VVSCTEYNSFPGSSDCASSYHPFPTHFHPPQCQAFAGLTIEGALFIASDGELTTAFNIAVFNELSQASVEREFEFRHYTVRECVSCKSLLSPHIIVCVVLTRVRVHAR